MPSILSRACALAALVAPLVSAKDWDSPPYTNLYSAPLPIAPIKEKVKSFTFEGRTIDYYEIDIKPFEQQVYPNLGKTRLVGYDGMAPGPTIMTRKGTEAVVRFINHSDRTNSVHLHGSYSRAPFDGWADDVTEVGQYKDYYYPNSQAARTLWYHDHAIEHTAENAYMGQAGFYILHDDEEEAVAGLPQGNYDLPLALTAKRYNPDGTLWSPEANNEDKNLFGDVIHVNGQPWPFHKVEPRKYRLRFLNAAISRSFELYFEGKSGTRANMKVVGSDAGLLTKPVDTTQLDISMAERWEVVFDFGAFKGQNVTLRSNAKIADVDPYLHTDKVMRFVVGDTVTSQVKNDNLPSELRKVNFPPNKATVDRSYEFQRQGSQWKVNGITWADGPEARVLAKPKRGSVERWILKNGSGGWTHPVHIHLIDFQIVSRKGGARNQVLPYEAAALKDVVWLNKNEEVEVVARYAPWDGLYMFHCHNLIHEDHEMMAAMNVTALEDLGYDEKTKFIDPMEQRYRAKSFSQSDFEGRTGDFSLGEIEKKVKFFNDLEAYRNVKETEEKLEAYWKTKSSGSGSTSTSSGAAAGTTLATTVSAGAGTTTSVPTTLKVVTSSSKSDDKKTTTKAAATTAKTTAKTTTTRKR
ncbi:hypothetical protein Q7P37_005854 [Cladosporium fusiforme]